MAIRFSFRRRVVQSDSFAPHLSSGEMRVLALISGGKDSGFAALECLAHGHEIVALGHLHPPASHASDELDSYMFQTVGHGAVRLLQECFGDGRVPLFQRAIVGKPEKVDLVYQSDNAAAADEVEDLYELVRHVQQSIPNLEAVSVGAILSDYQRLRVEDVCARLGLISLAYLWAQPQQPLVERMLAAGLDAVLVKVAALGLAPRKHLGRHLRDLLPELVQLADKYELNVAGEGGEYESLLLDLPTFHRRLVLYAARLDCFLVRVLCFCVSLFLCSLFAVYPSSSFFCSLFFIVAPLSPRCAQG